jgi:16S rRNA (uracil1498-N3)-methyltransferase
MPISYQEDKMEWVVEKATELGVSKIIPIISERSEKKSINMERANKIAIEASEQSGRATIPEILEPVDLSTELLEEIKKRGFDLITLDTNSTSLLATRPNGSSGREERGDAIFIGPEGGWSDKELNLFADAGAQIYSLGKLTLRAETAAVAALSKISL